MRITVRNDESVIVTIPHNMSEEKGKTFADSKKGWIEDTLAKIRKRPQPLLEIPQGSIREYKKHKEETLSLVASRLAHFNTIYGFSWKTVRIKNTSSRWGSCSKKGNLNFNYRLLFLPPEYADYVVVHELCHLKELNHSPAFWRLVEKTIPHYQELRNTIRRT